MLLEDPGEPGIQQGQHLDEIGGEEGGLEPVGLTGSTWNAAGLPDADEFGGALRNGVLRGDAGDGMLGDGGRDGARAVFAKGICRLCAGAK